jgi:hypothetical protein
VTRALIMAGGDADPDRAGHAWGGYLGVGRHFAPIAGEPLLYRIIRQLRANRITDIGIIAPDRPEYAIEGTYRIEPTTRAWGHEALNAREYWSDTERTIQVFGDVVFSERAMRIVCEYRPRKFQAFGYIRGRSGELFAISFWPEQREAWENALRLGFSLKERGIIRRAGSWEGYRIMGGARGRHVMVHRLYPACFTNILDGTNDIDNPRRYEALARRALDPRW